MTYLWLLYFFFNNWKKEKCQRRKPNMGLNKKYTQIWIHEDYYTETMKFK